MRAFNIMAKRNSRKKSSGNMKSRATTGGMQTYQETSVYFIDNAATGAIAVNDVRRTFSMNELYPSLAAQAVSGNDVARLVVPTHLSVQVLPSSRILLGGSTQIPNGPQDLQASSYVQLQLTADGGQQWVPAHAYQLTSAVNPIRLDASFVKMSKIYPEILEPKYPDVSTLRASIYFVGVTNNSLESYEVRVTAFARIFPQGRIVFNQMPPSSRLLEEDGRQVWYGSNESHPATDDQDVINLHDRNRSRNLLREPRPRTPLALSER